MKVRAHLYSAITDRVGDILEVIYCKLLWYHIDDLIPGRYISFILIIDQLINFTLSNFFIGLVTNNVATGLKAFDMMTCNTYIHFADLQVRVGGITVFQSHGDGLDGFIDVQYLAMFYAVRTSPPEADDL